MAGEAPDPIELWGRRIGRALGFLAAAVLLLLLLLQLRGEP
ncbi:hypothetical protein ACUSIJ_01635 [Pseudochelatococcus sp. B33]